MAPNAPSQFGLYGKQPSIERLCMGGGQKRPLLHTSPKKSKETEELSLSNQIRELLRHRANIQPLGELQTRT